MTKDRAEGSRRLQVDIPIYPGSIFSENYNNYDKMKAPEGRMCNNVIIFILW